MEHDRWDCNRYVYVSGSANDKSHSSLFTGRLAKLLLSPLRNVRPEWFLIPSQNDTVVYTA